MIKIHYSVVRNPNVKMFSLFPFSAKGDVTDFLKKLVHDSFRRVSAPMNSVKLFTTFLNCPAEKPGLW